MSPHDTWGAAGGRNNRQICLLCSCILCIHVFTAPAASINQFEYLQNCDILTELTVALTAGKRTSHRVGHSGLMFRTALAIQCHCITVVVLYIVVVVVVDLYSESRSASIMRCVCYFCKFSSSVTYAAVVDKLQRITNY